MKRAEREKVFQLGLALVKRSQSVKQLFLAANTTLNQTEAAQALGCQPRDVKTIIKPDYYLNGPKYKISTVEAAQKRLEKATRKIQG